MYLLDLLYNDVKQLPSELKGELLEPKELSDTGDMESVKTKKGL